MSSGGVNSRPPGSAGRATKHYGSKDGEGRSKQSVFESQHALEQENRRLSKEIRTRTPQEYCPVEMDTCFCHWNQLSVDHSRTIRVNIIGWIIREICKEGSFTKVPSQICSLRNLDMERLQREAVSLREQIQEEQRRRRSRVSDLQEQLQRLEGKDETEKGLYLCILIYGGKSK